MTKRNNNSKGYLILSILTFIGSIIPIGLLIGYMGLRKSTFGSWSLLQELFNPYAFYICTPIILIISLPLLIVSIRNVQANKDKYKLNSISRFLNMAMIIYIIINYIYSFVLNNAQKWA